MSKVGSDKHKAFIEENFVVCDKCGYNNRKGRIDNFGFCLCCKKILDEKAYLKYKLRMANKSICKK